MIVRSIVVTSGLFFSSFLPTHRIPFSKSISDYLRSLYITTATSIFDRLDYEADAIPRDRRTESFHQSTPSSNATVKQNHTNQATSTAPYKTSLSGQQSDISTNTSSFPAQSASASDSEFGMLGSLPTDPKRSANRDPQKAPLYKLSVDLINTYKRINEVFAAVPLPPPPKFLYRLFFIFISLFIAGVLFNTKQL